jgi:hypothetical protein
VGLRKRWWGGDGLGGVSCFLVRTLIPNPVLWLVFLCGCTRPDLPLDRASSLPSTLESAGFFPLDLAFTLFTILLLRCLLYQLTGFPSAVQCFLTAACIIRGPSSAFPRSILTPVVARYLFFPQISGFLYTFPVAPLSMKQSLFFFHPGSSSRPCPCPS